MRSALVRIFVAGFTQLRFDYKAVAGSVLGAWGEPLRHLDRRSISTAKSHVLRSEASRHTDEYRWLLFNSLNRGRCNRDRGFLLIRLELYLDVDEQSRTPGQGGIGEDNAGGGSASFSTEQRADVCNLPDGFSVKRARSDRDLLPNTHVTEVTGRHRNIRPDGGKVSNGKEGRVLFDRLTQGDGLFYDYTIEGGPELVAVQPAFRMGAGAKCAELLLRVAIVDFCLLHRLAGLEVVLLC
ncbi:hypothetical protein MASSI9I_60353 [Massilia sp. 9I]|nr:hypothetical protein MASSI9I_60353 [Massilia sp. 9I]